MTLPRLTLSLSLSLSLLNFHLSMISHSVGVIAPTVARATSSGQIPANLPPPPVKGMRSPLVATTSVLREMRNTGLYSFPHTDSSLHYLVIRRSILVSASDPSTLRWANAVRETRTQCRITFNVDLSKCLVSFMPD